MQKDKKETQPDLPVVISFHHEALCCERCGCYYNKEFECPVFRGIKDQALFCGDALACED